MNIRRGGQIRLAVLVRGNVERARHGRTAKADCLIQQQGSGEALLTGGAVQAVDIRQPRGGQAGTKRNIHNIGGRCGQGEKMGQSNACLLYTSRETCDRKRFTEKCVEMINRIEQAVSYCYCNA